MQATDQETDIFADCEMETQPAAVQDEVGKIDPETGEVYEPSLILRKFGWTEMPDLPRRDATPEQIQDFENKIDQVAERIAQQRERTARWRHQTELRCKPLDDSASFWETEFLIPMSKMLAEYRLPRFKSGDKKGQFSKKTMHLPSCSIKFTKKGGWSVHDSEMVKAHIETRGIENFKMLDARMTVKYEYAKLIAALNKGVLKDVPGTQKLPDDPLASAKIVIANSATEQTDKEEE